MRTIRMTFGHCVRNIGLQLPEKDQFLCTCNIIAGHVKIGANIICARVFHDFFFVRPLFKMIRITIFLLFVSIEKNHCQA